MSRALEGLRRKYLGYIKEPVFSIDCVKNNYQQAKSKSIVDILLIVSEMTYEQFTNSDSIDPLALKAIEETSPNFNYDYHYLYSEEQILGVLNTAKGKYFEFLVEERLNNGLSVGDFSLPEGYSAVLAESPTQPGWDIQILNNDGVIDEYIQLKATNSLGYIKESLEKYPEYHILATEEVANSSNGLVINSDISEESLSNQINGIIDNNSYSSDELISLFLPVLPLSWICISSGYSLYFAENDIEKVLGRAENRVSNALISTAVGGGATLMGLGLLSIPLTFFSSVFIEDYFEKVKLTNCISSANERLMSFNNYQASL
jgi:hypothetical protein